ncbi:MAG: hypothetical protein HYT63_02130 [Candidatus Yanofskybacteria bacterium]|nr:hypothetical protein [Candidatus Yanofskybacteria bacterium]
MINTETEILIEGGPIREYLSAGRVVAFQPLGQSFENIKLRVGSVTGLKSSAVHLLGIINSGTPEEMGCEVSYNPDRRGSLCGMIYNIKRLPTPTTKGN